MRACHIRALGIAHERERVPPMLVKQHLSQAFLRHRQRMHLQDAQPLFQRGVQLFIAAAGQRAEDDVILRLSDLHMLHPQTEIPDPAADQRRVEDQRLHEAIAGPAQHTVILRLAHGARIDQHEGVIMLAIHRHHAAEDLQGSLFHIAAKRHLDIWKQLLLQLRYRFALRIAVDQEFHHLLHDLIFDEPIHKIKVIRSGCGLQHAAHQIEAL